VKTTLTLLTTLLLAPLTLLHAQTTSDAISAIAGRKPSGRPLAPILDPGPESADGKRRWQGCPGIAITAKDRLRFTWISYGRVESDNIEPAYVLLFTSSNGGATFEGPVAVAKSPLGNHVQNGGLWIDPRGRLWWYYNAHVAMVVNIAADPIRARGTGRNGAATT